MRLDRIVEGIVNYLEGLGEPGLVEKVGRELLRLAEVRKNMVVVETAVPVEKEIEKEIEKIVGKAEFRINKDLVGGMRVTRGDQLIDLTVKKRVEEIYAE